jgi:hypothetical protein
MGSASTERWQAAQATEGGVAAKMSFSFSYYHQYLVNATYRMVSDLPILPVPGWPLVRGIQFGAPVNVSSSLTGVLPSVWLDGGTAWSVSDSQYEVDGLGRWASNSTTAGEVGSDTTISPVYYSQFLFIMGYSVIGGGSPPAPSLNYSTFGTRLYSALSSTPANVWLDKGSSYSLTGLLGVTSTERWTSGQQPTAGIASGALTLNTAYAHQFYFRITSNIDGGTFQPSEGWFDSGAALTLTATPSHGFGFERWEGTGASSYSGNLTETTVLISSPVTETAVFFPSYTIAVVGTGSVSYNSSSTSGSVQEGGTRVIFLPPGERITLRAIPSSFFYQFDSWSGTSPGSAATQTVSDMGPSCRRRRSSWIGSTCLP